VLVFLVVTRLAHVNTLVISVKLTRLHVISWCNHLRALGYYGECQDQITEQKKWNPGQQTLLTKKIIKANPCWFSRGATFSPVAARTSVTEQIRVLVMTLDDIGWTCKALRISSPNASWVEYTVRFLFLLLCYEWSVSFVIACCQTKSWHFFPE
jgi:hypothetical protein